MVWGNENHSKPTRAPSCDELTKYGDADFLADGSISESIMAQATQLVVKAYGGLSEDLSTLRTAKYLSGNGALKSLPPTESAFTQHVKCLATSIMKNAHIARPVQPIYSNYGWTVINDRDLIPCAMTKSLWPNDLPKSFSCKCKNGCRHNCQCAKMNTPRYVACKCHGDKTCTRTVQNDTDSEDE